MRDDRETVFSATRKRATRLIVVRAPAGIGKTEMVRRWAAGLTDTVVISPDVTPAPESAVSFWMRLITQLHSRGLISDDHLFRAASWASRNDTARRTALGQLLATIDQAPTMIVDDLQRAVSVEAYGQVIDDIAYFLSGCPRLRLVIVERERSLIDDVDIADRITITAQHVPPVAFLRGGAEAGHAIPPLRTLVQNEGLLRAICLAALPRTVSVELAHALTGHDGRKLLDAAEDLHHGAWQESEGGAADFAFRSSVRTDARAELRQSWPLDKIAAARRLAHWYLERSENTAAFEFAVIAEDVPLIGRIGLRLMPFTGPLPGDTAERLTRLPIERVHESAVISLWAAAHSDLALNPATSTTALYTAAAAAAQRGDEGLSRTETLVLTGIGSFAARRADDADLALDGAKQFHARALAILSEGRLDESLVRPFVEVAYQAGVTMMLGDEREAAVDLLVEVERICRTHGLEYRRSSAQAALGYHYGLEGRLRKASALTRAASAYTGRQAHGDYSFVAFLQVSALVQAVMKADFVRLRHAVGSLGGGLAHTAHWDVRLLGEMLLDLAAGDAAAARVHFDAAIRAHLRDDEPGSVHRRVAYLRGILALFGETPVSVGAMTPRIAADPIRLALSAAHDIDIDDLDRAAAKLKKATTRASLPFAQHLAFVMLARLGLAEGDATLVRSAATRLRSLLRTHDLRIGFALLTEQERTASVESLSDAREMRAAFAATTAKPSRFGGTTAPLLTPRQLVVIRTLAELGDRQAVADKLFLSPGTVKAHLRAIYKKLGAHSQTEALRKAAQLGLLKTAGGTALARQS